MNTDQNRKYWWAWGKCRAWLLDHGHTSAQADEMRMRIHEKALGLKLSSKALTNSDLDKVLAAFAAYYDGGNLDAQFRPEEEERRRAGAIIERISVIKLKLGLDCGRESSYVAGISRNVFGTDQWRSLGEKRLATLEGILIRRLRQLHSEESVAAILREAAAAVTEMEAILSRKEKKEEDPF